MSFQLDPTVLASITQEARQCFLDEDAPEYLQTLTEGLQERNRSPDFTSLLRAAHSLKGGAGLAGIPSLQELAHKLEDVLKLLEQGTIAKIDVAWDLVAQATEEISFVLTQARTVTEVAVSPELIAALKAFGELHSPQIKNQDQPTKLQNHINELVIKTLNEDLETQLLSIEELEADLPQEIIRQGLANFYDECLFVSETLDVPWLAESISAAQTLTETAEAADALLITKEIITEIREQRDIYLNESTESASVNFDIAAEQTALPNQSLVIKALSEELESKLIEIEELEPDLPEEIIQQGLANFYDECLFLSETLDVPWLAEIISAAEALTSENEVANALLVTKEIITEIREQRDIYLNESTESAFVNFDIAAEQTALENESLVIKALSEELEGKLIEIEELEPDLPEEIIQQSLANFYDECLFLSETLDVSWLAEIISAAEALTSENEVANALLVTQEIITEIRQQRDIYLTQLLDSSNSDLVTEQDNCENYDFVIKALNEDLERQFTAVEELDENLPDDVIVDTLANFHEECLFLSQTLNLPWITAKIASLEEVLEVFPPFQVLFLAKEIIAELRSQKAAYIQEITGELPIAPEEEFFSDAEEDEEDSPSSIFKFHQSHITSSPGKIKAQLRIPLENVENMTNNVEELMIIEARLNIGQKQLQQAQKRLQRLNSQFEPIREQVQIFYDQLAIDTTGMRAVKNDSFPYSPISPFPHSSSNEAPQDQVHEFDSLELDHYTELHSSLQSFQELMLQIQETRRDIDLINRNSLENLEQVRKNLSGLYDNVTESRLVPFKVLAQRFIPQIQTLNRRYHKSVALEIQGEDTLIDQVLLEQLQTPLTHLLNNAFDHGIEVVEERIANGKSEIASIVLKAVVKNNQLEISLQDDGRGINLNKVYQKAVTKGLCAAETEFEQLTRKEMLTWIFQPDFSTAEQVSDISGRGMGMDIVRSQILKLRGSLEIETKFNYGTTFILKLPLNVSLVSLLLVRLQNRLLAIPSRSVRETLLYSELPIIDHENPTLIWQEQPIPLASINSLLPCPREPITVGKPRVGIILEASFGYFAIAVDSLVCAENLIVKPFDDTIPIPPYLAGCTILGTGEVVPVILPQGFELADLRTTPSHHSMISQERNPVPTIMVAEDSVATRKLLEKIFTSIGCDVILCRDGQEAMEQFALHYEKISVVISDVEMPKRNGFELLESIKTHAEGKTVPVIMVTSRTGDRHRQKAQKLGSNGYLGKPIQPQELLTIITPFIS